MQDMNMKHLIVFCCALLVALSSLAQSRKSNSSSAVVPFTVKTVAFSDSSRYADVSVKADWPEGSTAVANAVRVYLKAQMDTVMKYQIVVDGGAGTPAASFPGNIVDGDAVTRFYSRQLFDSLTFRNKSMEDITSAEVPYVSNVTMRLTYKGSRFVTYEVETYTFQGGAHGSTVRYGVSFDRKTGNRLKALKPSQTARRLQPLLRRGVMSYFASSGQPVRERDLKNMLFIYDSLIPLPAYSPYFTRRGVHFVYQQYEIAPYAAGIIEFTIPYSKLK